MDLRVYVDGVARIICDLTRTTTVHDIIIALAQYKGKAGRYALIQRAPDGTEKTLSPHQLTSELIRRSDWTYILQQNPANGQKRSKSLDGRKTPLQQTSREKFLPITTSSEYNRTVQNHRTSHDLNPKRSNIHQTLPSITNKTHLSSTDSPTLQKRLLRTPPISHYSRPRSTVPTENNTLHILQHQQQYRALVQLLRKQEGQVEQQEKDLDEKDKEINYRENILHQAQLYQVSLEQEFAILEEHDRQLLVECQNFTQEYSPEKLQQEYEYQQQLHANYEHLQQQLTRCSNTLEQKKQLQDQLHSDIERTQEEIQQIQNNIKDDQKEIVQCEYELQRLTSSFKHQEDYECVLNKRQEEIERFIQQHQKQILELEIELIKLEKFLLNQFAHSSYHFHSTPSSTDVLKSAPVQLMNSSLLKLCPSGIWV